MSDTVPLASLAAAIASALIGSVLAAADTALTSMTSPHLGALIDQATDRTRKVLERIRRDDAKLRSTYLLGRIACITLTAIWMKAAFDGISPSHGAYYAALATVALTGTLSDVSTTLGRKYADYAAPAAALYLRPLEFALFPLAYPMSVLSTRLRGKESDTPSDPRIAEAEVEAMVDEVERSGLFGHEPAEMIRNVLDLADRTARDVMIPRGDIEAIELATPVSEVVTLVTESGHSRYPVYREEIDHVVGLLYAKDLFNAIERDRAAGVEGTTLRQVIRTPANFVAESQSLSSLMREMRVDRQHLAIVVDEFGAVSGIVTLEDVLEEIVGDIQDEHDVEEGAVEKLDDGRIVADASISMSDLSRHLGADIPTHRAYSSLAGMLEHHAGKVPEAGTAISKFGWQFIVRDVQDEHVAKVEIVRATQASA